MNSATLTFAFKRRDDSVSATTIVVQYSPDLATWTEIAVSPISGAAVATTPNGAAPDDILVTIPRGTSPRPYARLKIISIP